jgi:long-chain acyl-CoA synthetase
MSFNLSTMLYESARAAPEDTVMRFAGTSTTYAQLDEAASRIAAGLREFGLAPGEVVAVQLPNLPQFLSLYFGTLKAGLVLLPLNPLLKAPEIAYQLSDASARLLVTYEGFLAEAVPAAQVAGIPVFALSPSGTQRDGVASIDALISREPLVEPGGDIHPTMADDTAVVIYTSGTTGKPKGAELTHFQLYMNCSVAGGLFGARREDVTLAVLPFFHVFGLSSLINVTVRYGGALSLVPRFDPVAVLDTVETDRCTVIGGVPTMLQALAEQDITGRDLSRLRVAVSGGASLPGEIMRVFEDKFGIAVLEGYGLTETASTSSFNVSATDRKLLSIGKPIWGVQMRIADLEGRPLPRGKENVGEILIRGHNVMKGYLGRPEETAEAFRGGWFHSGDVGYADEDGFYFIVDRSKDIVIRGGYNVYPREIEEVLFEHPDVLEAAVIGREDERLGEEVVAVVVRRADATLTEPELIEFCRGRLAAYKYPREVRFIPELPKGPTGKILKAELRKNTELTRN